MKKINIFLCLFVIVTIFSGCGPSGTYAKIGASNSNNSSSENVTIMVERGPVFMAIVTDVKGKRAINDNSGFSNLYQFDSQPTYPITVKGGYIDINRNGKIDNNDSKLNITMSSYSNVVSPLTTIIGKSKEMIDKLNKYYKINEEEITQQVPSKSSKNAILLSNIVYKTLVKGFKIASEEFNQTVEDIKYIYEDNNFEEITDLSELSYLLEKRVIEDLNIKQLDNQEINLLENNLLENNSPINTLSTNTSSTNTSNSVTNNSSTTNTSSTHSSSSTTNTSSTHSSSSTTNTSSSTNNSFIKEYNRGENIQTIWNLTLRIPKDINIKNIDIGMNIVKESSGTVGNILIRGISIKNNRVKNIDSIDVFGEKISRTTGSVSYGKKHNVTKQSVVVLQDRFLLIKLGYIMEQQTIVSKESFRKVDNYNCTIYVSQLNIDGLSIDNKDKPLRLSFDTFYSFPKNTQKINGIVRIRDK